MQFIKVETSILDPSVKIVSLNRPDVKNAFHPKMISEITEFFSNEKSARLILLRGKGTAFCAGADLNWMKDMVQYSLDENKKDSEKLWDLFEAIQSCSVPVVGVAHGAVFGGALGLLVACDYVVAEGKTQFCFSEVKLGLAPAVISGFISRKIPDAFYRSLMMSAEVFLTEHAVKIGMVHQSFNNSISNDELIKKFAANGTEAMKATKKLLNSLLENSDFGIKKKLCTLEIAQRRVSTEGQDRLKRFLNK